MGKKIKSAQMARVGSLECGQLFESCCKGVKLGGYRIKRIQLRSSENGFIE
jgi:hypothetical protein